MLNRKFKSQENRMLDIIAIMDGDRYWISRLEKEMAEGGWRYEPGRFFRRGYTSMDGEL